MKVTVIVYVILTISLRQIQSRSTGITSYNEQADNSLSDEVLKEEEVNMTIIIKTTTSKYEQEVRKSDDGKEESNGLELMKIDCKNQVNLEHEIFQRSKTHQWNELATEDRDQLDLFFQCYIGKLGFLKPNEEVDFDKIAEIYLLEGDPHNKLDVATKSCRSSISQERYLFAKTEKFIKCIKYELE